jgi:hypothetical protein
VKKHTAQFAVWAVALFLTARLTWTAAIHDMPVLDTATIGIFALYAVRGGMEHLVNSFNRARQSGAAR